LEATGNSDAIAILIGDTVYPDTAPGSLASST